MNLSKLLWTIAGLLGVVLVGFLGYSLVVKKDTVVRVANDVSVQEVKKEEENNSEGVKPVAQQAAIEYKNTELGFSLQLPASWKGYKTNVYKVERDNYFTIGVTHPTEKIYPPADFPSTAKPIEKTYSFIVVPIATWNKWYVTGESAQPFAAGVGASEFGRNSQYVFAMAPRYYYGAYVYGENVAENDKKEGEQIALSFKVFNPIFKAAPTYPQNLSISGFKIVNGVAKATILDKCTAEHTVCDYDNPTVPVKLVGTPLLTVDGYAVGVYSYEQIGIGEAYKYLVLVGKDGKWRYDYIDCKNGGAGCAYNKYGVYPDSKNIYLGSGGRDQSDIVYLDAEKFLQSKKSHFVLNGYSEISQPSISGMTVDIAKQKWDIHVKKITQDFLASLVEGGGTKISGVSFVDLTKDSIPELVLETYAEKSSSGDVYRLTGSGDTYELLAKGVIGGYSTMYKSTISFVLENGNLCTKGYDTEIGFTHPDLIKTVNDGRVITAYFATETSWNELQKKFTKALLSEKCAKIE